MGRNASLVFLDTFLSYWDIQNKRNRIIKLRTRRPVNNSFSKQQPATFFSRKQQRSCRDLSQNQSLHPFVPLKPFSNELRSMCKPSLFKERRKNSIFTQNIL